MSFGYSVALRTSNFDKSMEFSCNIITNDWALRHFIEFIFYEDAYSEIKELYFLMQYNSLQK